MAVISKKTFTTDEELLEVECFNSREICSAVFDNLDNSAVFYLKNSKIIDVENTIQSKVHDAVAGKVDVNFDCYE